MIRPFPNTAAYKLRIFINKLCILPYAAGRITHRVRILAHKVGLLFFFILCISLNSGMKRIHPRKHICIRRKLRVVIIHAFARSVLAVDKPAVPLLPYPVGHCLMIIAEAALVTERPHNDRRVVSVAQYRSLHTFDKFFFPIGVRAWPDRVIRIVSHPDPSLHDTVCFDIGFKHNIKTELVAHFQKCGCRRIMGGSYAVYIKLLHQL